MSTAMPTVSPNKLLVIYKSVIGYDLIALVPADVDYLLVDPTQDGLVQLEAALDYRAKLDQLHVISHGSSGTVVLGSDVLNMANRG